MVLIFVKRTPTYTFLFDKKKNFSSMVHMKNDIVCEHLLLNLEKQQKSGRCVDMAGGGENIAPGNITEIYEQQRASTTWLRRFATF